jgi:hypothetical protein
MLATCFGRTIRWSCEQSACLVSGRNSPGVVCEGSAVLLHLVQGPATQRRAYPGKRPLHLRRTRQRLARRVKTKPCWACGARVCSSRDEGFLLCTGVCLSTPCPHQGCFPRVMLVELLSNLTAKVAPWTCVLLLGTLVGAVDPLLLANQGDSCRVTPVQPLALCGCRADADWCHSPSRSRGYRCYRSCTGDGPVVIRQPLDNQSFTLSHLDGTSLQRSSSRVDR